MSDDEDDDEQNSQFEDSSLIANQTDVPEEARYTAEALDYIVEVRKAVEEALHRLGLAE